MEEEHIQSGWHALLQGRQGLYCLTLTAGIALYAIISPISYTVLPAIIKELHAELYYSWLVMLFTLGSLIGACLLGRILRLMQAHSAYIMALFFFALCTLACAYASSLPFLLAARLAQGLSGGLLAALVYSMLNTALPSRLLPYGIGLISGMWGIAALTGPYLGGRFDNWRMPFFIIGIITLAFSIIAFLIFKTAGKEHNNLKQHKLAPAPFLPIFVLTLLVLVIGTGSVLEGLQSGLNAILSAHDLSFQLAISPLAANSGGLISGFFLILLLGFTEKRAKNRLLPADTFSIGSIFPLVYGIIILNMVALSGAELYLPLFLQNLHEARQITAGYIAFADSIGWAIGTLAGAALTIMNYDKNSGGQIFYKKGRFGRIIVFILAPLCSITGMAAVFLLVPAISASAVMLFLITLSLFVTGFFSGILWPHILALILQNAKKEEKEAADSSLCTVQFFAPALADCLAGTIVNAAGLRTDNIASVSHAASALFAFCLILLIIVFCLCLKVKKRIAG